MNYKAGDKFIYDDKEYCVSIVIPGSDVPISAYGIYDGNFRRFTKEEMEEARKIPSTSLADDPGSDLHANIGKEEMKSLILPHLEVLDAEELKKIYDFIVANMVIDTY